MPKNIYIFLKSTIYVFWDILSIIFYHKYVLRLYSMKSTIFCCLFMSSSLYSHLHNKLEQLKNSYMTKKSFVHYICKNKFQTKFLIIFKNFFISGVFPNNVGLRQETKKTHLHNNLEHSDMYVSTSILLVYS